MFKITYTLANKLLKNKAFIYAVWPFRNYFGLNLKINTFTRSVNINNIKPYFNRFNEIKFSALCVGIFSFFTSKEEKESTPENLFARALFAIKTEDFKTAIYNLQHILSILEEQLENEEITFLEHERKKARINFEFANIYLLLRDLNSASKLIIETMKSCFRADILPSNPLIIELSLKLALIYAEQENHTDADIGFKFCIENCKLELEKQELDEEETKNLEALLGMVYNYYSKFLYQRSMMNHALDMASKALDQALKIYDKNHPNIINIINDQGVIYTALKNHSDAQSKFQQAIDLCLDCPKDEVVEILPSIFANFGHLFIDKGDVAKAEEMCVNSRRFWKNIDKESINDSSLEKHIDDCFFKLAGLKSQQRED